MTVKDLITLLQECPPDAQVEGYEGDNVVGLKIVEAAYVHAS